MSRLRGAIHTATWCAAAVLCAGTWAMSRPHQAVFLAFAAACALVAARDI